MEIKRLGAQTVALSRPPAVAGYASVVGKKEGDGPLAASFDHIEQDDSFGEKTWEKSESAMQRLALSMALNKAGLAAKVREDGRVFSEEFTGEGVLLDALVDSRVFPLVAAYEKRESPSC